MFKDHFLQVYHSPSPSPQNISKGVQYVDCKVTHAMNEFPSRSFIEEEVEVALKQMAPLKSLCLDDFNPSFYQIYWHIVRDGVTSIIRNFLNEGIFDSCINFTYIVLIPKVKNLVCASNFRPIILCNVIYKLVSKVLANRIKLNLSSIISKTQSAFILGRLISNNIIVTYEALHSMKSR